MAGVMTRLDAINAILSAIGESPVSSLEDSGSIDVAIAERVLNEVNREVQAIGWHFNTERGLKLNPSSPEGYIYLPQNTLRVDSVEADENIDVVQRGLRLYDKTDHTYSFKQPITVDIVLLLDFEELPEFAKAYIKARAARVFQERTLGSPHLAQYLRSDEEKAYALLVSADLDNADLNVIYGDPETASILMR